MSSTATRLITLIMLLQRRPGQKAKELAAELGVSQRTVHRYVGMLEEMGIPVYSERGPHGGFSLIPGYKMPPLVFTPEEAVALHLGAGLAEELWGELYQEAARGALAKLDNVLPDEQRQEAAWAQRKLIATSFHRSDQEPLIPVLNALRTAVQKQRVVQMLYQSRGRAAPVQRQMEPYALVHRWGWWYVTGFCRMREALRTFRVDRIRQIDLLDEIFREPPDFDIRAYLAERWLTQPAVQARVRFAAEFAHLAYDDRAYWKEMAEQEDGSVVVILEAPDMQWAASIILAYGGRAMALAPPALREEVARQARRLDRLHSDATFLAAGGSDHE